jgi:tetratricopeptide (TPR) repeat protein
VDIVETCSDALDREDVSCQDRLHLLRARGFALARMRRYGAAMQDLEEILCCDPDDLVAQARLLRLKGGEDPPKAIRELRELTRQHKENGRLHVTLAGVLLNSDRYREAVQAADEALRYADDDLDVRALAFSVLAGAHLALNNRQAALENANAGIALHRTRLGVSSSPYIARGRIFADAGKYDLALGDFLRLRELSKVSGDELVGLQATYNLWNCEHNLGRYATAYLYALQLTHHPTSGDKPTCRSPVPRMRCRTTNGHTTPPWPPCGRKRTRRATTNWPWRRRDWDSSPRRWRATTGP